MTDKPKSPDFSRYTKDHWSCLLYIETIVVDRDGIADTRRMNQADRDAADDMEADGLLVWGGTGANPVFSLTSLGWEVAHAVRRLRAEFSSSRVRERPIDTMESRVAAYGKAATLAVEARRALDECREAMDMSETYRGEPNYSDADVIREALRHARMRPALRSG